jgi:hypothetical protein
MSYYDGDGKIFFVDLRENAPPSIYALDINTLEDTVLDM